MILAVCLGLMALTAHAAPAIGDTPPDDVGASLGGDRVRISERRGKVVIVAFWASWCPYCRKELPVLQTIQRAAGNERLEIVVVDYQEPPETYRDVARKLKRAGLLVTHDRNGAISEAYGVKAVPHLVMIGKAGRVGWIHHGYAHEDLPEIGAAIDRLLAEPAPTEPQAPATPGG